ncbi:MAG: tetratricopeptide repeat protein [Gammaproteobacteria bacterium]
MPTDLPPLVAFAVTALLGISAVQAQGVGEFGCGSLENAYGPFDYTNPTHRRDDIPIVVGMHFPAHVQSLTRGQTGTIGGDIDYTLRAIPNHHAALNAIARYEFQTRKSPPPGSRYTVDCWFDRAMRFKPDDGVVRMVYGIYLAKKGATNEAAEKYQEAITLLPNSPEPHYNLGLLYANTGEYGLALEHAHIAYSQNYPLNGLRRKLQKAGEWREIPIEE